MLNLINILDIKSDFLLDRLLLSETLIFNKLLQ